MSVRDLFSDADLAAIRDAAQSAERRTSGEVVTFVVERSGAYPEAPLRGALLGAALGLAAALVGLRLYAPWGAPLWGSAGWGDSILSVNPVLWIAAGALAGAVVGYGSVGFIAPLRRLFAGRASIDEQVRRRAASAFVEEEVFATRDRTGMLLFISRFEHRVVVLGDAGINAKVEPSAWSGIAGGLASGINSGHATEAVIEAIEACGKLLEDAGVERRDDDIDELPNAVRIRDA